MTPTFAPDAAALPPEGAQASLGRPGGGLMNEAQVLNYVKAAAQAVDLPLTEAGARAVAAHLGRTVAMARLLDAADLAPEDELAEIYRPAPFPAVGEHEDLM